MPVSFDAGTYSQGSISLPRLDAIAAKDASGKLWLEVMNLDPENPVEIEADLVGVAIKSAAGETLTAPKVDSVNTVEGVKDETGLLMWDIMNEPFTNSYYERATGDEKKQREAEITEFVRYNLTYVKKLDPVNTITEGEVVVGLGVVRVPPDRWTAAHAAGGWNMAHGLPCSPRERKTRPASTWIRRTVMRR